MTTKSVANGNLNLNKTVIRLLIPLVRNSIGRSLLRRGFLLIPIAAALAWFEATRPDFCNGAV
jgi:hypothetical protein